MARGHPGERRTVRPDPAGALAYDIFKHGDVLGAIGAIIAL